MINIFLTLGLLLIIQLYIVLYISDKIEIKNESKNNNIKLYKKFVEFIVILIVIFITCFFYLRHKLDSAMIIQITIFCELFIILFWIYLNFVDDIFNFNGYKQKILYNKNNNNNNILNNKNNNINSNIFKKYINNNNNFSFEDLYPNYNNNNNDKDNKKKKKKDYSAYNGYPPNHICYNCGCIKDDKGHVFCGKEIPGIGVIGCSENWKCSNCKKCKKGYDNSSNKQYECKNCKCHDTIGGKICGTRGKLDGEIHKCNSSCYKCLGCGDGDNNNNNNNNGKKYLTIYTKNNLNYDNVVINNMSKIDIDNIL